MFFFGAKYKLPNGKSVYQLHRGETRHLYREIFERKVYLRHGIALNDGDLVFDVGANIGLFTLFITSYRHVRVLAFEPIPEIFLFLQRNLQQITNCSVEAINCGLAANSGIAPFCYYLRDSTISSMHPERVARMFRSYRRHLLTADPTELTAYWPLNWLPRGLRSRFASLLIRYYRCQRRVTCRLTTVSQVIKERGLDKIALLKIDAEHSEQEVLAGIAPRDWDKISQMAIEVHGGISQLQKIATLAADRGFCVKTERDTCLGGGLYMLYARRS